MIKIYKKEDLKEIFARVTTENRAVEKTVSEIIQNVRVNGDKALREYSLKFDKTALDSFKVTAEEMAEADALVDKDYKRILKTATENIKNFHKKQLRSDFAINDGGKIVGQKVVPLSRVGIYVPGGTASYPSTVLMNAVPALIAGVKEIVMVSPPKADGKIRPEVLVAARIAGVTEIYKVGGAQAVAALAYGTESIKKVNKITGPGNIFVATAKKQVFGTVDIDMIAGPSEIMIIADDSANPKFVASDLLSQAEHDKMATAVLITPSEKLAKLVQEEVEIQLDTLERKEIARESIDNNGKIIIVDDLTSCVDVSNELAPEHLEICTEDPMKLFSQIENAGSVFLGNYTPEALGDYYAGTNHTLPTSGTAKYASALGVEDFIKTVQYIKYDETELKKCADDIIRFAESEGLTAHANSVKVRK